MNKLRVKTLNLARRADFVFWDGEPWGPEVEAIDWSSDYDEEIVELVRLTVKECASFTDDNTKKQILNHFGIKH